LPILPLACRDWRDAACDFRLLIVRVALGMAAIAACGLLSSAVLEGVGASARMSLGASPSAMPWFYLVQVLAAGLAGAAVGLLAGGTPG